jgi:hypothetical protein
MRSARSSTLCAAGAGSRRDEGRALSARWQEQGGGPRLPLMALCVIGGAPPNFRSRRTSRLAETNFGAGKLTYSGPSPNLVGASMNGSKRSSEMLQSSATGEPSPPFEQMEAVLPSLPLEKQLSISSSRYGVRAGRPTPQSKPYGFSSNLVVTTSDQRMDAAAAAAVTMRMRAIALHYLHYWVTLQHRKRIGANRLQSGRHGHTDRANEDRSKNVTHLVPPFVPIGPWP